MSNYLAIASVTEVLGKKVLAAAEKALGKTVLLNKSRPDDPGRADLVAVHVYLYQVTTNAAFRNQDLPSRNTDGRMLQKPQAALDLHYLLTFYGNDQELEPQRMLGAVISDLHAHPTLTKAQVRSGLLGVSYLAGSDLADAVELVKLTPVPLSLEESSKLWSVLLQTKHALSIAYQGSVVLIESEDVPQQALPVSERGVTGTPFMQPLIEQIRVVDNNGEVLPVSEAIGLGAKLSVTGNNLKAQDTQVLVNGIAVASESITDTEIRLQPLPEHLPDPAATPLRAGIASLQVLQSLLLGEPAVLHPVVGSNVMPFMLRPTMSVSLQATVIRIQVSPKVAKSQRVVLILNELTSNPKPKAYRLNAPSDNGITAAGVTETSSIDFKVAGIVAAGTYLVRVQVDGAESLLQKNAAGLYDQPQVLLP